MPVDGVVPAIVLTAIAGATVFTVMFALGLGVVLGEFRWVFGHPGLVARGLFSVLVAVPAIALVVTSALRMPRLAEIGVVLMAISPGAPFALRRSLETGGHRSFAPALQIMVALSAVVAMPLWIAVLNEYYAGQASIAPSNLAKQVFFAQLLPLGLGMLARRVIPSVAIAIEPRLVRLGTVLLIGLAILALIDVGGVVIDAGIRIAVAIAVVTVLSLAVGHLLGGPEPATRTAVAISSAARNPGLALLVATFNGAPPEVGRTLLVFVVISAFAFIPYMIWRRRAGAAATGKR